MVRSRNVMSVPFGSLRSGQHELLLIGCGNLLVEVVKIAVVLRLERS